MDYYIIENSWICRIGRMIMKTKRLAMVIGRGIHLSGVKKEDFLKDEKWVRHELIHIEQYKRYGKLRFLLFYLIESAKKGYYKNKFEVEARERSQ